MIYIYAIILVANICQGVIAYIAGDHELLQHNEIVGFLVLILITLESKEE